MGTVLTIIQSGGAIGLAFGNAILQNVFVKELPPLSDALTSSLRTSFALPAELSDAQGYAVKAACMFLQSFLSLMVDMSGLKKVFILLMPIVGVCLVLSFFMQVGQLNSGSDAILT